MPWGGGGDELALSRVFPGRGNGTAPGARELRPGRARPGSCGRQGRSDAGSPLTHHSAQARTAPAARSFSPAGGC